MRLLIAFGSSFLSALAGCLSIMLVFGLFESHSVKPWVAVGIAAGAAIANAIRAWRKVSPNAFSWLIVGLVSAGSIIGTWFSGGG
ncbi:hypothetical protein GCM10007901_33440 [Dyella acidisoli]|uniref:Holin n=1 Tax=Dyella acidisoli TaxID=1867834 RepID=A0ABQ5XSS4_9GAMM|nr:hypothetical protein GCM10007901_33440 [Dyella acidisoli]